MILESIAQKDGDKEKRTSDRAHTRDLHSFMELQPHEPLVPAANPSSPIAGTKGDGEQRIRGWD